MMRSHSLNNAGGIPDPRDAARRARGPVYPTRKLKASPTVNEPSIRWLFTDPPRLLFPREKANTRGSRGIITRVPRRCSEKRAKNAAGRRPASYVSSGTSTGALVVLSGKHVIFKTIAGNRLSRSNICQACLPGALNLSR